MREMACAFRTALGILLIVKAVPTKFILPHLTLPCPALPPSLPPPSLPFATAHRRQRLLLPTPQAPLPPLHPLLLPPLPPCLPRTDTSPTQREKEKRKREGWREREGAAAECFLSSNPWKAHLYYGAFRSREKYSVGFALAQAD